MGYFTGMRYSATLLIALLSAELSNTEISCRRAEQMLAETATYVCSWKQVDSKAPGTRGCF